MSTRTVTRLSPSAVSAAVIAGIALMRASAAYYGPFETHDLVALIWELAAVAFIPVAGGVIALWLAKRADQEIARPIGQLSGATVVTVARVCAVAALAISVTTLAITTVFAERPMIIEAPDDPRPDVADEPVVIQGDDGEPIELGPGMTFPPPPAPALPAEPDADEGVVFFDPASPPPAVPVRP